MGVKQLNSYLKRKCKSLKQISLCELKDKRIAVDISIYIYKYLSTSNLLENIFNMCFKFRQFDIHAVFVFDGKPPKEKNAELKKRSLEKKTAESSYNSLSKIIEDLNISLSDNTISESEKNKIIKKQKKIQSDMTELKKKFIRINDTIIADVKSMILACGLRYIESPYEADVVCAHLVNTNKVYAVMSEDMDMFVYGCYRVLRYYSIINNTCVLYTLNKILKELKINKTNFQQLCIYSGTDYNDKNATFYNSIKLYNKNIKEIQSTSFFDYIDKESSSSNENTPKPNMTELYKTMDMFNLLNYDLENLKKKKIKNMKIYNKKSIQQILKKENFIFV